jgi:oxygen-dependent protoporphyrinogen oxidase
MTSQSAPTRLRVAVIGGGISGLATAYYLTHDHEGVDVTLTESSDRTGGLLRSEHAGGYLFEHSADNFITNLPWGMELCRRVGLGDDLLRTDERYRRAFVVRRGRLHPVPDGFTLMTPSRLLPIVISPLLSPLGKLRLLGEPFIRARTEPSDESLASFVTRRLGREAFRRLVQPLVGGIYTADPERLSMQAALPRFVEMERRHGSLLRAARHAARQSQAGDTSSGARYSMFVAPRAGMEALPAAIAAQLPDGCIQIKSPVTRLARHGDTWQVKIGDEQNPRTFDAVVLAVSAGAAARLVEPLDTVLADELARIPYAGAAIVSFALRRDQIAHPLDGFGFVVPETERRPILAASFTSVKFTDRAPDGGVLIRVFLGGACHPEVLERDEVELREIAWGQISQLLGITGTPHDDRVTIWRHAMPQYHLGHTDRVARINERVATHPGLALAGNAYTGVGIPQCIHSAEQAARNVVSAQL